MLGREVSRRIESLRPTVAAGLAAAGHDAVHVAEVDLLGSTDEVVMPSAARRYRA